MGVFKLGNSEINSISLVEPYESVEPDIIKPTYDKHLDDWVRPSEWLDMPVMSSGAGDEKVAGLIMVESGIDQQVALYTRGPYVSHNVYPTYNTIDWGDGTVVVQSGSRPNEAGNVNYFTWETHTYSFDSLPVSSEITYKGRKCRQALFQIDGSVSGLETLYLHALNGSAGFNNFAYYRSSRMVDLEVVGRRVKDINLTGGGGSFHLDLEHIRYEVSGISPYRHFNSSQNLRKLEINPDITLTNANAQQMFYGCTMLKEVPYFDTSSITQADNFFWACRSLKTIPNYDFSNNTHFNSFYSSCSSLEEIPNFDYSNGIYFNSMCAGMESLISIPSGTFNISSLGNCNQMFRYSHNLVSIPPDFDFSGATHTYLMFDECYNLRYVPKVDLPNCVNPTGMFQGCRSLKHLRFGDLSKATTLSRLVHASSQLRSVRFENPEIIADNFTNAFSSANLARVPNINYSSGVNFRNAFQGNKRLKYIPKLTLTNATDVAYMFQGCTNLEKVGGFEFGSRLTSSTEMFRYCENLIEFPSGFFKDYNSCPSYIRWMFASGPRFTSVPDLNLSGIDNMVTHNNDWMPTTVEYTGDVIFGPNSIDTFEGTRLHSFPPTDVSDCDLFTNTFKTCRHLRRCQIYGLRVSTSFRECGLPSGAITEVFENLASGVTGQNIDIYRCEGVNNLHPDTIAIATSKGWTVTT